MRVILLVLAVAILATVGCNGHPPLLDSDVMYLIPAGVPFKAKEKKNGPLVEYVKDTDMAVVHPGYLQKLQEEADAATIKPR